MDLAQILPQFSLCRGPSALVQDKRRQICERPIGQKLHRRVHLHRTFLGCNYQYIPGQWPKHRKGDHDPVADKIGQATSCSECHAIPRISRTQKYVHECVA